MPANQTILSAKSSLPWPLAPPYYVNRTDAWQGRVMEAARSYFRPAEFADLQRLEIRFVPQEAERIKRHLRRRGDYTADNDHPARADGNTFRRDADITNTNALSAPGQFGLGVDPATFKVTPAIDANGRQLLGAVENEYLSRDDPDEPPKMLLPGPLPSGNPGRLPRKHSLLRRTQLFIASIFVFDQAHALLRHLREECLSLTSAGTEADEGLLKQIVRNVRGFTFRELKKLRLLDGAVLTAARNANPPAPGDAGAYAATLEWNFGAAQADPDLDQQWVNAMAQPPQLLSGRPNPAHLNAIMVKSSSGTSVDYYCPKKVTSYSDFRDFYEPFSQSELENLKNRGYIMREDKYYCPHRLPEWMSRLLGADDSELYTISGGPSEKFGRIRNQMVYPVTYLTNGQIADDTLAARLIEHCNAAVMNPEYFSWGVRRFVFLPLEVDMFDITRFNDMDLYDSLHETLNAFSTGIYEGMNLEDLWPVVRKKYQKLPRQVPRNMLPPFDNVCKKIDLPASAANGARRNFANEEVLRLFLAADDCIRIIGKWYQNAGFMNRIDFANYRHAVTAEDTLGNRPDFGRFGEAYGAECGAGMKTLYYTADPDIYPDRARLVPDPMRIDPLTGKMYREQRLVSRCVPLMDATYAHIGPVGGEIIDAEVVVAPR